MAQAVVVKKHGGTLDFETEIGKGTTFIIRMPLQRQGVEEPV
jgi:signal transduction histidine kinase